MRTQRQETKKKMYLITVLQKLVKRQNPWDTLGFVMSQSKVHAKHWEPFNNLNKTKHSAALAQRELLRKPDGPWMGTQALQKLPCDTHPATHQMWALRRTKTSEHTQFAFLFSCSHSLVCLSSLWKLLNIEKKHPCLKLNTALSSTPWNKQGSPGTQVNMDINWRVEKYKIFQRATSWCTWIVPDQFKSNTLHPSRL